MVDYRMLYHIMIAASEDALEALENGNPALARELLIAAGQKAEEMYIEQDDD